jgi:hypothetical protein
MTQSAPAGDGEPMTVADAMHICSHEPINSERFREAQQTLIDHARRRALRQQAEQHASNWRPPQP